MLFSTGRIRQANVVKILVVMIFSFSPIYSWGQFEYVTTHPYAANQVDTKNGENCYGARIQVLKTYQGKIYAGYGDGVCNTGPIRVCGLDPATKKFDCEFTMKTESIQKIDVVGDDLMIAAQDPMGTFTEGHAYATKINGVWEAKSPAEMSGSLTQGSVHNQRMTRFNGDLYLAGDYYNSLDSKGQHPVLWKSPDNGQSWEKFRYYPESISGAKPSSFCAPIVFNGKMYAQVGSFQCNGLNLFDDDYRTPEVFDSVGSGSYSGLSYGVSTTAAPQSDIAEFKGELVYLNNSRLLRYNGVDINPIASGGGTRVERYDINEQAFTVGDNGEYLYVHHQDRGVCRAKFLSKTGETKFKCFDVTPGHATSSIAVLGDYIYVGTVNSEIWRAPIPKSSLCLACLQPIYKLLLLDEAGV